MPQGTTPDDSPGAPFERTPSATPRPCTCPASRLRFFRSRHVAFRRQFLPWYARGSSHPPGCRSGHGRSEKQHDKGCSEIARDQAYDSEHPSRRASDYEKEPDVLIRLRDANDPRRSLRRAAGGRLRPPRDPCHRRSSSPPGPRDPGVTHDRDLRLAPSAFLSEARPGRRCPAATSAHRTRPSSTRVARRRRVPDTGGGFLLRSRLSPSPQSAVERLRNHAIPVFGSRYVDEATQHELEGVTTLSVLDALLRQASDAEFPGDGHSLNSATKPAAAREPQHAQMTQRQVLLAQS